MPPAPPVGPGGGDGGEFVEGSSDRPDLYPDRWVYSNNPYPDQIGAGVANHITGHDVRVSFTVEAQREVLRRSKAGRSPTASDNQPNVFYVGLRIGKPDFLAELAKGSLARLVERTRGYPRGTIINVSEVSIAEAWGG